MGNERETVHKENCNECIHHWVIDQRNFGICRKCGAGKQFLHSWSAVGIQKAWGNTSSKSKHNVAGTKN